MVELFLKPANCVTTVYFCLECHVADALKNCRTSSQCRQESVNAMI